MINGTYETPATDSAVFFAADIRAKKGTLNNTDLSRLNNYRNGAITNLK